MTGRWPKRAVLDFHGDDETRKCSRAGMFRLWQEIRRFNRTTPLYLREATAGSIRPAARCRHTHPGEPEDAAAHSLALRGSLAERSGGFARRRHDGPGSCGAAGRVNRLWTGGPSWTGWIAAPLR